MKKNYLILAASLALTSILAMPFAPLAMATDGNIDLRLKMRNADVAAVQKDLAKQGLFKAQVTGFFGALTEKAVKQFQQKNGLPETGIVDSATKEALANKKVSGKNLMQLSNAEAMNKIQELMDKIKKLEEQLKAAQVALSKQKSVAVKPVIPADKIDPAAQAAAGIIITGGVSGPGYPTGPLNLTLPASQLLFDRAGQVKEGNGALEIKDRQYEAPLETIPPTFGAFPVAINGVLNTATELKVISNLKAQNGVGKHSGTIDIDIDTVPAGHLTLSYSGSATVVGSTITSKGTFKTAKTTGIFAGLVANGTYNMTIVESGNTVGAPVTVTLSTASQ